MWLKNILCILLRIRECQEQIWSGASIMSLHREVVFNLGCTTESLGGTSEHVDVQVPPTEIMIQLVWDIVWVSYLIFKRLILLCSEC